MNLLLSVVTLGIYSAWAKVRRMRYFCWRTRISPVMSSSITGSRAPDSQRAPDRLRHVPGLLHRVRRFQNWPACSWRSCFSSFVPWLAVKALTFRARMSPYRNIRFAFEQDHHGAAEGLHRLSPCLVGITLGLFYPYFAYARYRFAISNTSYGTARLNLFAGPRVFYWIYFQAALLYIAAIAIGVALFRAWSGYGIDVAQRSEEIQLQRAEAGDRLSAAVAPSSGAFLNKCLQNATLGNVTIHRHRLLSGMQTGRLFWLYLSNTVLNCCDPRALHPWARVRWRSIASMRLALEVRGKSR